MEEASSAVLTHVHAVGLSPELLAMMVCRANSKHFMRSCDLPVLSSELARALCQEYLFLLVDELFMESTIAMKDVPRSAQTFKGKHEEPLEETAGRLLTKFANFWGARTTEEYRAHCWQHLSSGYMKVLVAEVCERVPFYFVAQAVQILKVHSVAEILPVLVCRHHLDPIATASYVSPPKCSRARQTMCFHRVFASSAASVSLSACVCVRVHMCCGLASNFLSHPLVCRYTAAFFTAWTSRNRRKLIRIPSHNWDGRRKQVFIETLTSVGYRL